MTGRIQAARQRAADAKRRLAVLAAVGFVATFGLAAVSHGGTAAATSDSSAVEQPAATEPDTSTFDFGTADVAPSGDLAPQVQTQTS